VVLRSILPSQISFGDRTAKINERAYKHAGWPAKSKYLLVFLGGGDKLLGGRKPSHIKGMIHSPWREARLGHFSAQLRVSAGRQPTAKIIKTNTHLPSWMRKFLLEGAFSAVNPSGARIAVAAELAYRYPKARLVYVGGNASLRSANLSEPQRSCSPTTSLST